MHAYVIETPTLCVGRSIVEHLGPALPQLSELMCRALGEHEALSAPALHQALLMADQHEALRLIASAYRENLIGERAGRGFAVHFDGQQMTANCAASAARLRSAEGPRGLARIVYFDGEDESELLGVDGVLIALQPYFEQCQLAGSPATWGRLLHACHQSVRNEAMALAYQQVWQRDIEAQLEDDIFAYLSRPDVSTYELFNQLAAFAGRPITPFSKMKLDLSVEQLLAYSPEFSQSVPMRFAALRRSKVRLSHGQEYADFDSAFLDLFPQAYVEWAAALDALGRDASDYCPMPLHPLNVAWAAGALAELVSSGDLVLLDGVTLDAVPTLSFRSMLMHNQCLKVAAPLQTTHLIRNIALPEIEMGPLFSDLFDAIIRAEGMQDKLVLERDLIGACLDWETAGCSQDVASMFSFVSRQNPDRQIAPGHHVLPVAGLFVAPPGKRRPFFFNIMKRRGIDTPEAQYAYFADYVATVVGTQLELYFKTGLMLEAHQQNLNLVFDADWALLRLMYHDIPGGVAAYVPLLTARHVVPPALASGIFYFRNTPERSVFQFVHPTLNAHLGLLARQMRRHLDLDGDRLHAIIRAEIERWIAWGRTLPAASEAEALARATMIEAFEEIVLRSPTLPGKMMLGRIYLQSINEDWGVKVPNPELLSERVLIPPAAMRNFLAVPEQLQ